ncbi:hypothetical protein XBKQ1_2100025 [Xenorhabdus bovienii str. kraussei Quebec]|uniref:Uncharacterized protein n=1 Tax=Xenorhabdus bovienii str. kraussei Quebec TaxID=1398203 RepID=A0A077PHZ9_XENBV|nr:hypothetical protein XBKQ1_2100025 [Xenorhabdus bovienii str. kraussei Quebec]
MVDSILTRYVVIPHVPHRGYTLIMRYCDLLYNALIVKKPVITKYILAL